MPGLLKYDKKRVDWESNFIKYFSTIVGVNGVKLSYMIRENNNPPIVVSKTHVSFIDETIYCAQLTRTLYNAD